MKKIKSCFISFSLIFVFLWNGAFSQDNLVDSLKNALKDAKGETRFEILYDLARLTSKSEPKMSLVYAQDAYRVACELNDARKISDGLNGLAIVYYYLGNQRQSLKFILESIDQMKIIWNQDTTDIDLQYRIATASNNAGNVLHDLGELDKSLEKFLQTRKSLDYLLEKQTGNEKFIKLYITCLNNTALIYRDLHNNDKAELFLNEALKMSRQYNFLTGIAMSLNNLGLLEIERKAFSKAYLIFSEALQVNQKLNDSIALAGTFNNFGLIDEKTGESVHALENYKASLLISERLGYLYGISNTSVNVGNIYLQLHQTDSAKKYLNLGLKVAESEGILKLQEKSLESLSELYRRTSHYEKALDLYKGYTKVRDSIFNLERTRQVADMEAKYEMDKKERENVILRKDNAIYKTTRQLMVVVISGLFILTVMLYFLFRFKNRTLKHSTAFFEQEQKTKSLEIEKNEIERKYLEDQLFAEHEIYRLQRNKLDEQNRKLAATALQVTAKNMILSSILNEIELANKVAAEDRGDYFRRIRHIVMLNFNLDKDWEQFKLHFAEVHPDFFVRLKEHYPELTPNELKICAYYRINLDTNDIALILNATISAVQKSRHRLRKKLGLEPDTNITEFMMSF
ncbi:MAG: tetratricopeptide repeat protein [Bacteroidales bacterium]|nr:tetratricopeptide repeat protein [Lentimicrobiaceae bacterium]MDD5695100.1 tetratricopeptide repeat protein [Bacteroidales bacterium]